MVAINAATTHLYAPGVRRHMQNAIKEGATVEEILEVIQLTSVMGIHACNLAVPILMEEMAAAGQPGKPAPAAAEATRAGIVTPPAAPGAGAVAGPCRHSGRCRHECSGPRIARSCLWANDGGRPQGG